MVEHRWYLPAGATEPVLLPLRRRDTPLGGWEDVEPRPCDWAVDGVIHVYYFTFATREEAIQRQIDLLNEYIAPKVARLDALKEALLKTPEEGPPAAEASKA